LVLIHHVHKKIIDEIVNLLEKILQGINVESINMHCMDDRIE